MTVCAVLYVVASLCRRLRGACVVIAKVVVPVMTVSLVVALLFELVHPMEVLVQISPIIAAMSRECTQSYGHGWHSIIDLRNFIAMVSLSVLEDTASACAS